MQERVRLVNGDLVIESRPGAGTSIRARVPLSGADRSVAIDGRAQFIFFRVMPSRPSGSRAWSA